MSNLLKVREIYKPFEYPQAYDFYQLQRRAHWSADEVGMAKDIQDWKFNLTDSERLVIGQILKSFIQTEIHVNEYWSQKVGKWFPKPEIQMMATTFSSFEALHTEGYAYLNDSLGLDDYDAFLQDPSALAKLDRLRNVKDGSKGGIAKSLAIFSGFTEGVNLFSSFAVLMGPSRFNMLEGLKTIVSWSIKDEELHSKAGCWLFRKFIEENPQLWTDELKKDIYEAARVTVQLEDDFINNAFSLGKVRGLSADDLKVFIRMRANQKLVELGLKHNWKNIDKDAVKRMEWFNTISGGTKFTDFFHSKVVDYFKCNFNEENLFEGLG